MSPPRVRKRVANEWRKVCGEQRTPLIPASSPRLRTSGGHGRPAQRPPRLVEEHWLSAGRLAAQGEVAAQGADRGRAERHQPFASALA